MSYKSSAIWRKYAKTEKGIITTLLNYAKDRAEKFNIPFELDREFIKAKLDKGICEVSGLEFEAKFSDVYKVHPYTPSLDRIDPDKGYTKDNTRMVCFIVNRAKSDWTDEILFTMAKGIVEYNITK